MSMWEIDALLTSSIKVIQKSDLEQDVKRHIIWSLEHLPETYGFDAGGFKKSELDPQFEYREIDPFELGLFVADESKETDEKGLIYDWSAFLINFSAEYFAKIDSSQKLEALQQIKSILFKIDFSSYKPKHPSLTIYRDGHEMFSDLHNNLIKWFVSADEE